MRTLRLLALAGALMVGTVYGADVDGTWLAKFQSPDGQTRENTFILKADGDKLTGTLHSGLGDAPLQDGTVKGNDVAFTVVRNFNGTDVTFKYAGTVSGNTMKLKATAGDREVEMTATRQ